MILDHRYHRLNAVHEILSNACYPLQWAVDVPARATRSVGRFFKTHKHLVKQNESLREQQFLQEGRLQRLLALEAENVQLRSLLQASPRLNDSFSVAEILKVDSDPFNHSIIINKGTRHGCYVGQPIVDAQGVVGVIIEVLRYTSRALLITDSSHAIPVETVRNGVRGIVEGIGSVNHLQLQYVPTTADIMVGDILVTSGLGGRFPAGYPVGVVELISQDASKSFAAIRIKPSANLDRGRQVLLIQNQYQKSLLDATKRAEGEREKDQSWWNLFTDFHNMKTDNNGEVTGEMRGEVRSDKVNNEKTKTGKIKNEKVKSEKAKIARVKGGSRISSSDHFPFWVGSFYKVEHDE